MLWGAGSGIIGSWSGDEPRTRNEKPTATPTGAATEKEDRSHVHHPRHPRLDHPLLRPVASPTESARTFTTARRPASRHRPSSPAAHQPIRALPTPPFLSHHPSPLPTPIDTGGGPSQAPPVRVFRLALGRRRPRVSQGTSRVWADSQAQTREIECRNGKQEAVAGAIAPATALTWRKALPSWLVPQSAYLIYSTIRGPIVDWYPYPFFNPDEVGGYGGVAAYAVGIAALAALGTWVIVLTGQRVRIAVAPEPATAATQVAPTNPPHAPTLLAVNRDGGSDALWRACPQFR